MHRRRVFSVFPSHFHKMPPRKLQPRGTSFRLFSRRTVPLRPRHASPHPSTGRHTGRNPLYKGNGGIGWPRRHFAATLIKKAGAVPVCEEEIPHGGARADSRYRFALLPHRCSAIDPQCYRSGTAASRAIRLDGRTQIQHENTHFPSHPGTMPQQSSNFTPYLGSESDAASPYRLFFLTTHSLFGSRLI